MTVGNYFSSPKGFPDYVAGNFFFLVGWVDG